MLTKDPFADGENVRVMDHLDVCSNCRNLYRLDLELEENIKASFDKKKIPEDLCRRIEKTLESAEKPVEITNLSRMKSVLPGIKKSGFGLVACLVLVVTLAYLLFFNKPFRYQNLQQLNGNVVALHLSGDTSFSFTPDGMGKAVAMLSRELKFNVIIPDLESLGYTLLGGRLCHLGKCKTAYLFYQKENKTASLFILDYGHLQFEMADGSRFSNDMKGCHTDIWKENGQVYAMVY